MVTVCQWIVLSIFLNWLSLSAGSAFAEDSGAAETVGWQSDPNGRGTFTLVSSCVFTLTICVYSALHLNVPPRNESKPKFWFRNIRWIVLGIFGPELVVFIAWKQYLSAKAIVRRSKNGVHGDHGLQREDAAKEHTVSCNEKIRSEGRDLASWSIVHGFCAGMGCFAFQSGNLTTDSGAAILGSTCQRLTLTARGVALLADCGLLPDIERKYLNDKSKSDGLSKFVACVQAAWLIVQVIGRLILGLQVTLLEINTLGHVFCALTIYLLWWHKPRMVLEPISLDGDFMGPLCAYMYMTSLISGQKKTTGSVLGGTAISPEIATIALIPGKSCKHATHSARTLSGQTHRQRSMNSLSIQEWKPVNNEGVSSSTKSSQGEEQAWALQRSSGGHLEPRPLPLSSTEDTPTSTLRFDCTDESQDLDVARARWCLATEAVLRYPAIRRRFSSVMHVDPSGVHKQYLQEIQPEELVQEHCSNWSTKGLLPGDFGLVMGMALWFASMAFGGIHAAAWYDYFPTSIESWLWRCSSLWIIWCGLFWCLINLIAHFSKPFDDWWNRNTMHGPPFAKSKLIVIICFICGTLYTFARLYLVIEAFISIRKLPRSAYQTPEWTQIIPHL